MSNCIKDYQVTEQVVTVLFDQGQVRLEILTSEIIRVLKNCLQDPISSAIEGKKDKPTTFSIDQLEDKIVIVTQALSVEVSSNQAIDVYDINHNALILNYSGERFPLAGRMTSEQAKLANAEGHEASGNAEISQGYQEIVMKLATDEQFYGLGDKTGFINKRGYEYDNWNTDNPAPQLENFTRLYKSIPFLLGQKEGRPFGLFFDNTNRSHFDLGKENPGYYYYSIEAGYLDYYLIGGATLKAVIGNYTYLTGRTPLPQRWTLGYQQSRWGYQNAAEIKEVATKMREYRLPCDVIHLDIDYMDGFRVFTWDNHKYPDLPGFLADLKKQGIKIVTIIDPGVKQDEHYQIYEVGKRNNFFVKTPEGYIYVNRVWPGESVYPDFGQTKVREWWAKNHQVLTAAGVSGIWNDMNEPASFVGEIPDEITFSIHDQPATHAQVHNVYGHYMSVATYQGLRAQQGRRPFVITRAAYAGTQKYATVWTGDNHSIWAHLQMMIPQLCNLGMSGFAFAGTDIGGFGSDTTAELLTRWIEAAIFSPLLRNHSAMGTRMQEPWAFGEPTLTIYRKFLELRYHLIPYLYDLFAEGEQTGLPVMRPLILADEHDPRLQTINDQYLVGDQLLVAPIVQAGQQQRLVYLPEGDWIDFWTGQQFHGQQDIITLAPLDHLPLFMRTDSILPWSSERQYVSEQPEATMTFRLFGKSGQYQHYQDNGLDYQYQQGVYNLYQITMKSTGNTIKFNHKGYQAIYQTIWLEGAQGKQRYDYCDKLDTYQLVTK